MNYDELLAPAAKSMRPSGIRKFFDLAAEMPHCISLGVGEPDFKTPWTIRDAGIRSLEQGRTRYTANAGIKELRAEICRYLARRMELNYQPSEVLVTVGGSEAIDLTIRAMVKPGDEVIIPERTKLLILPYPNNPTGGVMDAADLEAIAEVLRGTDIMVLSDEIYAELTYGLDRHISIATLPGMKERTIVVNGFSKAYAMTGWRLGYAVGPEPVIKVMTKIHQSCIMSAPTTSQYAAIAALRSCDDSIEMMRDEYNRRRRYVVKALNDMGLTCFEPRGAFYVFPCIRCSGLTSQEFCEMLLKEQEVAIIPGDAFGASGEGYARISYAYSVEHLETAMRRIRTFLKDHGWLAE